MAQTGGKLIIKLYLPRSGKRGLPSEASSDASGQKKRKIVDSEVSAKKPRCTNETPCCNTESSSLLAKIQTGRCSAVKENSRVIRKESRIMHDEECKLEKEKKKMDRYKKMQCWVILKRLMTGRDAWLFKQSLFLKDLKILDHKSDDSVSKPPIMDGKNNIECELESTETIVNKPIGLEDIESKLNKWLYFEPDEFAADMRLVFSYAMLHPPRNEIHKIAKRLSEDFEIRWKSLKEKWLKEERKGKKKICKRDQVQAKGS